MKACKHSHDSIGFWFTHLRVLTARQPSDTLASSIIICHAVRPDVGTEAAVTKSSDSGLRANSLRDTSAYSACAT
jgi:hypothetical protein